MKEVTGNLWTYPADVRVITTNSSVKKNGEAVMGRGCAAEAKALYPMLPRLLGDQILKHGNVPVYFLPANVLTFPVKYNWYERATIDLIRAGAKEIVVLADRHPEWQTVLLPRPGCGNGKLDWERDVKPVLAPIFDDRFHVITRVR